MLGITLSFGMGELMAKEELCGAVLALYIKVEMILFCCPYMETMNVRCTKTWFVDG